MFMKLIKYITCFKTMISY